ncbi:mechanosensitive ion channel family protein [Rhizobium sp. BK661]|uniref:mechanosensitive ion channel family protein n=1 Tax=Rhizobium sp. BK661 TaxID=2586991 RepID=UPI00216AA72D|nr:mechanosensitive ion channel family protein [Rhizobium sp. BK661]MCS3743314.1 small-conductance mechanosensitive channel [Rhizobium sp. BK661]
MNLDDVLRLLLDPITQFAALVVALVVARTLVRGRPTHRFIVHIAFFAILTILLVGHDVAPWTTVTGDEDLTHKMFIGVAKATWWAGGAMVLASSVRVFLIFERKPREGRLIQDLLVAFIYLGAALSIIAFVFDLPVRTLVATSGVFAIVLGLALQSTLNDVFSGIALNLGRPYTVGDWIEVEGGARGQVVETNWRSTHLLNDTNDLVIVPNSTLAKATLTNLTGTDSVHGSKVVIRALPTRSPAVIEETMKTVLLSANTILKYPAPSVSVTGLDGSAVEVELSFKVANLGRTGIAKNEIFDLVFRHAKAAGIQLSTAANALTEASPAESSKHPGTPWRLLTSIPLFSALTEDEMETVANTMKRCTFKKGLVIAPQNASMTSLMIVRSGVVSVERDEEDGRSEELTRLAPGDLFGERGVLMGAPEPATMRALTFVVVYEISKDHLASVMHERPALVEELSQLLAKRVETEEHLRADGNAGAEAHPVSLAAKIRHLFRLPHGSIN